MQPNVVVKINALDQSKAAFDSLKRNMGTVQESTAQMRRKMDELGPVFQKIAAAGAVALGGIALVAKSAIKNASDLGESINAVNVVFGEGADEILKFGETAAKSVGLAKAQFNQMATITGALLKDTGQPLSEVADMTTELATRAADMASVFNTDVSDAMSAINQAIRGETEAIRRYAGDVTDASLQTFLFSQGIQTNVTDLTEQEKRLVRVQLIMQQTAVTAGDFANTSDSLANRQRILQAELTNLSAKIGQQLIPVLEGVLSKVAPIIQKMGEWIEKHPVLTRNIIIATAAVAGLAVVVGALALAVSVLMSPITLIIAGLAALGTAVYVVATKWQSLPLALKIILLPIKLMIEYLKDLYAAFMWVADGVVWFAQKVTGTVATTTAATKGAVVDLQGTVNRFADPLAGQSKKVENFGGSIAGLGKASSETADKIKRLKEEAAGIFDDVAKDDADSKKQLAEAIIEQENGISDKKKELRQLEKDEDNDSNATRIRELRKTIADEEQALRTTRDMRVMLRSELDEAERRASLSDFERKVEDIQKERVARLEAQLVRLQEIQQEIGAEKLKSSAIAQSFGAAQSTMQSAIAKTREVAETEAERMKKAFDRAVSSMSQLSGGKLSGGSFFTSSKISGRASGGPVTGGTPYIVGEVGPELFVPNASGTIIPNNALQPAMAGGSPIYVTITGNSFMGEKDMAERLLDKVVGVLKQNQRV
jgi:hypothetical protein